MCGAAWRHSVDKVQPHEFAIYYISPGRLGVEVWGGAMAEPWVPD